MGKTKWYSDDDAFSPRHDARSGQGAAHNRRRANVPGRYSGQKQHAQPLPLAFKMFFRRLRRNWVAFHFQLNRLTLGAFRRQAAFKLGLLALVGYLLFGTDDVFSTIISRDVRTEFVSNEEETTFDVGGGGSVPKGKSLKNKAKNDAAPVGPDDVFDAQARDYVARFHDIAIGEMQKYGIPASISLAQGLVESRAGTSRLARSNNNHFGMKCFSRNCRKGHCSNFTDDSHKDFFRIYQNPWESWRAHSIMLSTGRYSSLKQYGRDYRKWAYGLKRLGYATNSTYAEKIIGMIERYELHQYDQ